MKKQGWEGLNSNIKSESKGDRTKNQELDERKAWVPKGPHTSHVSTWLGLVSILLPPPPTLTRVRKVLRDLGLMDKPEADVWVLYLLPHRLLSKFVDLSDIFPEKLSVRMSIHDH